MARIKVNSLCNVLTGDDSNAYRSADPNRPVRPEITIPRFKARLSIFEANELALGLLEAIEIAKGERK